MTANKETIIVVVSGKPFPVEADVHAPIQSVVARALELSSNTGQPIQNWELRDADGYEIDLHKKVGDFPNGTKLFLNQEVGVGG